MVRSCQHEILAWLYVGILLPFIHFHSVTVSGGKTANAIIYFFASKKSTHFIYIFFYLML